MVERGYLMLVVSQFIGVRRRIIFAHFGRVANKLVRPKEGSGVCHGECHQRTIHFMCLCLAFEPLCSDIPMAQFIINYNNSLPASQKFIIHILDNTHLFVQPHASEMIRNTIQEFREQNSYEKPA